MGQSNDPPEDVPPEQTRPLPLDYHGLKAKPLSVARGLPSWIRDPRGIGSEGMPPTEEARHLQPGDGCFGVAILALGFLYGLIAGIGSAVLMGMLSGGAESFALAIPLVLVVLPIIISFFFRSGWYFGLGVLLSAGMMTLIAGACGSRFHGL